MDASIECKLILTGIENLEQCLQRNSASDALEIEDDAETTQKYYSLTRLKKSLIQYSDRTKRLVYVGFMGHFSTGKSSTINSLLSLGEESSQSRRVGQNPIDKHITLITHTENRDSLMSVTKENIVSIRSEFIDHDFLRNIVIADTPGTGDPILAHEIAQDFLPICDLIIYFFNAAVPLDNSDIPLLKEKSSHLPFIPIKFVITRADEFKRDRQQLLSEENINSSKVKDFLSELEQRVSVLFQNHSDISRDGFILIDNIDQYNLDLIQDYLVEFCNSSNVDSQIRRHEYKTLYFKNHAEKLQDFFCIFLEKKLGLLSKVLAAANENIDRYKNKIRVSNNDLTQSWKEKYIDINNVKSKLTSDDFLPYFSMQNLDYFIDLGRNRTFEGEAKQESIKAEIDALDKMNNDLILQIKKVHGLYRQTFIERILSLSSRAISEVPELDLKQVSRSDMMNDVLFLPPPRLIQTSYNSIKEIDEKFIEKFSIFNKSFQGLNEIISSQEPLDHFQSLIDSAVNALSADFEDYFEAISIYRSGILSIGARDAIAKLGLGHQIDSIEANELTDSRKAGIKNDAQECIFPNSREFLSFSRKRLAELNLRIENVRGKLKILSADRQISFSDIAISDVDKDALVKLTKNRVSEILNDSIDETQRALNLKISSLLSKYSDMWGEELRILNKERRNRIRYFVIFTCSISSCILLACLLFWKVDLPSNLPVILGSGILVNLISTPVAKFLEKMTNDFPESSRTKEKSVLQQFHNEYDQVVSKSIDRTNYSISLDDKTISGLWIKALTEEPRKKWVVRRTQFREDLGFVFDDFNTLRDVFIEIIDEAASSAIRYFEDSDRNIKELDNFSANLKNDSIQPSFQLLEDTKANIESMIREIRTIRFS